MDRRAGLALDEVQCPGLLGDDVDLGPARLAIVLEVGMPSPVDESLGDLTRNPALEERTAKRMVRR